MKLSYKWYQQNCMMWEEGWATYDSSDQVQINGRGIWIIIEGIVVFWQLGMEEWSSKQGQNKSQ